MNSLVTVLLVCSILLALAGCSEDGPQQRLDNYLNRLANTLATELDPTPVAAIPKPPKTTELRLTLPSANLDAIDFLSLTGCTVQVTIGKRNSSLGIFASDSQRLLLELEYLQYAPACIDYMREQGKSQLAQTLETAFILKRTQLRALIYNATLANTEFRDFWKKPRQLSDYPEQTSSVVLSALGGIVLNAERWLAGDYRADNKDFEILLSEVARGDGGALLLALATQEAALESANRVIRQSIEKGPLCFENYRNEAADILPRVIQKYFITEVQPWSAALGRRYHELIPPFVALETVLTAALPTPYSRWQQDRDSLFPRLTSAPGRHVQALKQVLAPCSETPGRD